MKISVPFILMFLGFWVTSTTVIGTVVEHKLEQDQLEQAAESAALVERKILRELDALRKEARLLALVDPVVQGTLQQKNSQLQKAILPVLGVLETNLTTVINKDEQPLFNFQDAILEDKKLRDEAITELLITGSDIATVSATSDFGPPVLIGTAPIKNRQGIVGGILLGITLGDEQLADINQSINEHILVLLDGVVVASTFASGVEQLETLELEEAQRFVRIEDLDYLAQVIKLDSLGEQQFELVLLICQQPLRQAKQALWVFIVVIACIGSAVTTGLGYWIARRVAKPIQDLTLVAQRVAGENRFDLRAATSTQDEISILALSLNQLIEWVGQYTYDLEVATQTLETRVDERTQELSSALKKLKDTQAQLIQTEKMSSLGQMIAGIAHEINNPIGFVQGNIEPLQEYFQDLLELIETYQAEYPEPTPAILSKQNEIDFDFLIQDLNKLLRSMDLGAERVQEIVKSLRNFSRLDEATVKDVDIHEGLDSTLLILNHRIKHHVTVTKEYGELPLVRCFPAQLNQVFTNILVNALDAMSEVSCDRKHLTIATRALTAKQVQVIIRDSGPGIPKSLRNKIFDPFFTTKPVGKGTGLGLGICFKIIQQHQGTIDVRSKIGKGTEFVITLPTDVLPADPVMMNAKQRAKSG